MARKKELHTYILLDRSGSMAGSKWVEAISSINYFIQKQKEQDEFKSFITVAAFDSETGLGRTSWPPKFGEGIDKSVSSTFTILRESCLADNCIPISFSEISPRGGTPLFDATAQLLDLAAKKSAKYTSIVIMTDGEENSSVTWGKESIKNRLEDLTSKFNWQVTFLGADFDVSHQAMSVGVDVMRTASLARGRMNDAIDLYSSKATNYVNLGSSIMYSAKERADLNTSKEK